MPHNLEFKLVDAFTLSPFAGNVAGVILQADGLTDRQMQLIAREFNASETTFVLEPTVPDAAVRFRWFTPGCEVGFCGHATLGGVHALLEAGRFSNVLAEPGAILPIETKSGVIAVRVDEAPSGKRGRIIWIATPHNEPKRAAVPVPMLAKYLGLDMAALDPGIPAIRTQDDDVILGIKDLSTLLGLDPPMSDLARYCRSERIRGVCVTTTNVLSAATAAQSRFFAPAVGVDEDPVTGSVHGPLGLHLVNSGVVRLTNGKAAFLCAQAKPGGRAGVVHVIVMEKADGAKQVRVGGNCVTAASGTLDNLPSAE